MGTEIPAAPALGAVPRGASCPAKRSSGFSLDDGASLSSPSREGELVRRVQGRLESVSASLPRSLDGAREASRLIFCFPSSVGGKFGSANVFCATARPWPFAVFAGGFNVCLRVPCAPPASPAAKLNTDAGGG